MGTVGAQNQRRNVRHVDSRSIAPRTEVAARRYLTQFEWAHKIVASCTSSGTSRGTAALTCRLSPTTSTRFYSSEALLRVLRVAGAVRRDCGTRSRGRRSACLPNLIRDCERLPARIQASTSYSCRSRAPEVQRRCLDRPGSASALGADRLRGPVVPAGGVQALVVRDALGDPATVRVETREIGGSIEIRPRRQRVRAQGAAVISRVTAFRHVNKGPASRRTDRSRSSFGDCVGVPADAAVASPRMPDTGRAIDLPAPWPGGLADVRQTP